MTAKEKLHNKKTKKTPIKTKNKIINKKNKKKQKSSSKSSNKLISEKIKNLRKSPDYLMANKHERQHMINNIKRDIDIDAMDGNMFDLSLNIKFNKKNKKLQKGGDNNNDLNDNDNDNKKAEKPEISESIKKETPQTNDNKDLVDNFLNEVQKEEKKEEIEDNPMNQVLNSVSKEAFKRQEVFETNFVDEDSKGILDRYINLQYKNQNVENEGMFLIGVNILKIIDLMKKEAVETSISYDFPGKYKNEEERQKDIEKLKKMREESKLVKKDIKETDSIDFFGEFIDIDKEFDLVNDEIFSLNSEIAAVKLNPEAVLDKESNIKEILEESKKYKYEKRNITPKGLLNMAKMLYKNRKNMLQWLRVVSLIDIIYKYTNKGETREQFFKSNNKLDMEFLLKLDELWKTDFIFRGFKESKKYRKDLSFYK